MEIVQGGNILSHLLLFYYISNNLRVFARVKISSLGLAGSTKFNLPPRFVIFINAIITALKKMKSMILHLLRSTTNLSFYYFPKFFGFKNWRMCWVNCDNKNTINAYFLLKLLWGEFHAGFLWYVICYCLHCYLCTYLLEQHHLIVDTIFKLVCLANMYLLYLRKQQNLFLIRYLVLPKFFFLILLILPLKILSDLTY